MLLKIVPLQNISHPSLIKPIPCSLFHQTFPNWFMFNGVWSPTLALDLPSLNHYPAQSSHSLHFPFYTSHASFSATFRGLIFVWTKFSLGVTTSTTIHFYYNYYYLLQLLIKVFKLFLIYNSFERGTFYMRMMMDLNESIYSCPNTEYNDAPMSPCPILPDFPLQIFSEYSSKPHFSIIKTCSLITPKSCLLPLLIRLCCRSVTPTPSHIRIIIIMMKLNNNCLNWAKE